MPPDSAVDTPPKNAAQEKSAEQLLNELVTRTSDEVEKRAAAKAAAAQAALDAEKTKSLDQRNVDQAEMVAKILAAALEDQRKAFEARLATHVIPGVGKKEIDQFSFAKLIVGSATKNFSLCAFEVEMCREAAKVVGKDMSTAVDSAGGFIVPNEIMAARLIPLLQAQTIAEKLGVQNWTGLSGSPVEVPKITAGTTGGWIQENAGVSQSNPTFGQLAMTPHLFATQTQMSLRTVNLSSPAAEQIVTRQIARDTGLARDAAVFNGTGASGQPTGIMQTSGINTGVSFGSAVATGAYNKLIDMITEVMVDNALTANCGWAIDPTTWAKLQKMADASDQPKERRLFGSMPIGESLLGYKYATSTQLPANTILFGDFSMAAVGTWGTMILRTSQEAGTSFQNFQVWIQGAMEMDVAVLQPTAFSLAQSVS